MKLIKWAFAFLFIAQCTTAQETAFLKGQFVEFVVNKDGVLYASENIPSGFHNTQEDFSLVADPDRNGWEVGSPAFYGDYFAPGAPMEGFAVQLDEKVFRNSAIISKAKSKQAFDSKLFQKSVDGNKHTVLYQGEITQLLNIEQKITFIENDTKIKFEITVKNLDTKAHQVFYSRFADSDVNKSIDGSFRTSNHAKYSKKNSKVSIAKGSTKEQNGYFSMFTTYENSNSSTDRTWFAKPKDLFNHPENVSEKDEDANINLTFDLGEIEAEHEKYFTFYYLLSKAEEEVLCEGDCNKTVVKVDQSTFIHSGFPEKNYGSSPVLQAMSWSIANKPVVLRSLYKPDFSNIPARAKISKATLNLYEFSRRQDATEGHSTQSGSNESAFYPIITEWNPEEASWSNQPEIMSEKFGGLVSSETHRTKDYLDVDITPLIQYLFENQETTFGFMIKLNQETGYRSLVFASDNNEDVSIRPRIDIKFESPDK